MSDDLNVGGSPEPTTHDVPKRRLVPMQVGDATVYISCIEDDVEVEGADRIYAVALPGPKEAFDSALDVIKETIAVIGTRVDQLGKTLRPQQLSVEFSVIFEASGTARLIPVLVTGSTKASTGLKITALWMRSESA